jgi:hypothetical protein
MQLSMNTTFTKKKFFLAAFHEIFKPSATFIVSPFHYHAIAHVTMFAMPKL